MNFGENLKIFRKNSKISQEVLAEKIGVSRQAVSRWEVGDAYPEMNNIVALCSIFHCNINDLINDNIVDIESFDNETKEGIVKFKKEQQKRMKGVSKAIYIITNIVKYIFLIPALFLVICSLVFPFLSRSLDIKEDKIKILNNEYELSIDGNNVKIDNYEFYIETTSDINKIITSHSNTFFIISIEYIFICFTVLSILTFLSLHSISKLYKNIYNAKTPFTLENEKLVFKACMFLFIELILQKLTAIVYSLIGQIDLSIDFNIKDVIFILIGVSIVYLFKYGRLIQADSKSKIYD